MDERKMRVPVGSLLRMEWGVPTEHGEGLGPPDGSAFFAIALGRGRILAPSAGGPRVWSGFTFWAPTPWCNGGTATRRGDGEGWLHANIV
jgi:hypothetical protein